MSDLHKRFQIRRLLGTGSFGVVYEALDLQRSRIVALKTLTRSDADAVTRFKQEFRSLAELRHPNLASMYELLVLGDEWILSMELVRGTDLLEHLSFAEIQSSFLEGASAMPFDGDERISVRRTASHGKLSVVYLNHLRDAFRQLAEGIAFLHANGVVHRDIKPSNVMITQEGRVVLLDFGLASASGDAHEMDLIVGTPGYMSPEQIAMAKPAPASDWYSFGVILYQALTGHMPFSVQGAELLECQLRKKAPEALSVLSGIPEELALLADACIERDPALRPQAAEILERFGSSLSYARGERRMHERSSAITGRGRELRTLRRHVAAALEQGAGLVLLHGSPGSGKSALADHLLDRLREETDALIIGGRCQPWESLPLNAIDAMMDSVARVARAAPSPAIDHVMGRSVAMTRLFPALGFHAGAASGDDTIVLPSTYPKAVQRSSGELHALLAAIAGERPVVLFLDDAQWGDYQSAEVFRRLLTKSAPPPLAIICSYRTEDWRTSLLLQALKAAPVPQYEIEIGALSTRAIERMIKQAAPGRGRAFAEKIAIESAGNAGLVDLILSHANQGGAPHLADAVAARVGDLSASARRVFALLLGADGPLADDVIERSLELFESDEPLRTLTRARLIRPRRTGDLLELDIYHPRLRELLRGPR